MATLSSALPDPPAPTSSAPLSSSPAPPGTHGLAPSVPRSIEARSRPLLAAGSTTTMPRSTAAAISLRTSGYASIGTIVPVAGTVAWSSTSSTSPGSRSAAAFAMAAAGRYTPDMNGDTGSRVAAGAMPVIPRPSAVPPSTPSTAVPWSRTW